MHDGKPLIQGWHAYRKQGDYYRSRIKRQHHGKHRQLKSIRTRDRIQLFPHLFLRRDSSCQFLQRVSNPIDKRQARAEKRHSIRSLNMKSQKRKKSQGEKREEPGDGARRGKKRRGRAEKEHRGAEIHHLHHRSSSSSSSRLFSRQSILLMTLKNEEKSSFTWVSNTHFFFLSDNSQAVKKKESFLSKKKLKKIKCKGSKGRKRKARHNLLLILISTNK